MYTFIRTHKEDNLYKAKLIKTNKTIFNKYNVSVLAINHKKCFIPKYNLKIDSYLFLFRMQDTCNIIPYRGKTFHFKKLLTDTGHLQPSEMASLSNSRWQNRKKTSKLIHKNEALAEKAKRPFREGVSL